jgi:alkylation response protein AidB-like acyl-CoA dehydrogenase
MFEDLTATEEQHAFAEAAARSFSQCVNASSESIVQRVAADGFLSMLIPQEMGGLGLALRSVLPVARAAGRHLLGFPLIEAIVGAGVAAQRHAILAEDMASGEGFATIAWGGGAVLRNGTADGPATRAPSAATARWLAFRVDTDVALIDLRGPGVEIAPSLGLDLGRPYADILLRGAPLIAVAQGRWRDLADAGAILRTADMLGAAEASFADACAHVSTRHQFGKPLSGQQAVSGALARDHFALTAAALSIEYAALTNDENADDATVARDVACSVTADACIAAAENAIQLHGALGFTAEMPLHRRLRRIQEASDIYSAKTARAHLADSLLDTWKEAA